MQCVLILLAVVFAAASVANPDTLARELCFDSGTPSADKAAQRILERYLATPHPAGPSKTDPYDPKIDALVSEAQLARQSVLEELRTMPKEAVSAAEPILFTRASPIQRYEIVDWLADNISTRACAELLHRVLKDVREPKDEDQAIYEQMVRSTAVGGLRRMARRTDRSGARRVQKGPNFEPAVRGLTPYLISAVNDKAEGVRVSALYALADTLDPVAVDELKKRLEDESPTVRLYAACFLTEYQDAAGLPLMRKALGRLNAADPRNDVTHYSQAEMLLASFERITGKSFGEIPLNPLLASSDRGEARRYKELLEVWDAWWNWQPGERPQRKP
jgi:HEAT repeats